jgi:hypothetical protein
MRAAGWRWRWRAEVDLELAVAMAVARGGGVGAGWVRGGAGQGQRRVAWFEWQRGLAGWVCGQLGAHASGSVAGDWLCCCWLCCYWLCCCWLWAGCAGGGVRAELHQRGPWQSPRDSRSVSGNPHRLDGLPNSQRAKSCRRWRWQQTRRL